RNLRRAVPPALVKTRKQGGTELSYLEWSSVADLLDIHAPGWDYEIKEVKQVGEWVVATVAIIIDGVRRENTGVEKIDSNGYGDPISNAVAMAFKRCAAVFGVGRDLYQEDDVLAIIRDAESKRESLINEIRALAG